MAHAPRIRRSGPARRERAEANIEEIRARSWEHLNTLLYQDTWNESIQRFRSDWAYRGLPCSGWPLTTSLARLGGDYRELEGHLLRNFRKYAHQSAVHQNSEWAWLAVAQHHGLPTRLLDWTYSPYIALHFATEFVDRLPGDAVIWCVNYVQVHQRLPRRLRAILQRERSNAFTVEMLNEAGPSLMALEKLSRNDFAVFLEPPSLDQRIVNQFGLFSLMSSPDARLDRWLADQNARLVRRVLVPAELQWEVRDKLDQSNITERVLFPGLDGLSRWLRRHYTPKTVTGRSPASPVE